MTIAEFLPINIVRSWASQRGRAPFTSARCFDEVKDIDDVQQVYMAISTLYNKEGALARRKNSPGNGYEYIWHLFAGADFEFAPGKGVPAAPAPSLSDALSIDGEAGVSVRNGVEVSSGKPAEPEIPEFLRKGQPAPKAGPAAPVHEAPPEQPQSFSAEAIADALIRKIKPVLQAQFANAALETSDVIAEPCSRVTIRIEKLELTVEGLL